MAGPSSRAATSRLRSADIPPPTSSRQTRSATAAAAPEKRQPPRRGAPAGRRGQSIVSMTSQVTRDSQTEYESSQGVTDELANYTDEEEDDDDGDDDNDDDGGDKVQGEGSSKHQPAPEIDDTLASVMAQDLPHLLAAAKILKYHLDAQAEPAARDKMARDPVYQMRLSRFRRAFLDVRDVYEAKPDRLIDWVKVVKSLPKGGESDDIATPILTASNIVWLIDFVQQGTVGIESDGDLTLLQTLDEHFPTAFVHPNIDHDWITDERHDPIGHAIAIRTLRYVLTLKKFPHSGYTPRSLLAKVFCDTSKSRDHESLLRNGPFKPFGAYDPNVDERMRSDYVNRVTLLSEMVEDRFSPGDLERLEGDFTLDYLATGMLDWCRELFDKAVEEIDARQSDLDNRRPVSRSEQPKTALPLPPQASSQESQPTEAPPTGRISLFNGFPSVTKLFGRSSQLQPTSKPTQELPEIDEAEAAEPSSLNSGMRTMEIRAAEVLSNLPSSARNGVASTSDRDQSNARFSAGTKRRADEAVEEEDEDEDENDMFEVDDRQPNPAKRAQLDQRQKPPPIQRAARPEPRGSRTGVRSRTPVDDPMMPDLNAVRYAANQAALTAKIEQLRSPTEGASKRVQQRTAWTNADTALLIKDVAKHAAKWAVISRQQMYEHHRDQQAIRDKARNLKVDFLKGDFPLPEGFDLVALGSKERDKLISLGKNPYRKEDDVDEDGEVINTVLEEEE